MPFKTETIAPGEPAGKSIGQTMRQVKQLTPGESALASLDGSNLPESSIATALMEESEAEKREKAAISNLLLVCIEPPLLSRRHPNPLADKISFTEKVKGMTLPELRRFVPMDIDPLTIDPKKVGIDFRMELQKKYKDLSP